MAVPPVHAQRSRRDEHVTAHKSAASFGPPIFTQIFATFATFCSKFSSLRYCEGQVGETAQILLSHVFWTCNAGARRSVSLPRLMSGSTL